MLPSCFGRPQLACTLHRPVNRNQANPCCTVSLLCMHIQHWPRQPLQEVKSRASQTRFDCSARVLQQNHCRNTQATASARQTLTMLTRDKRKCETVKQQGNQSGSPGEEVRNRQFRLSAISVCARQQTPTMFAGPAGVALGGSAQCWLPWTTPGSHVPHPALKKGCQL